MNLNSRAVIRKPCEGRTVAVVGDVYRYLATGEDTNGKYALWEAIVPPGGGPPPHVHSREEEGFYILEGEITGWIGDQSIHGTTGTLIFAPRGVPHSFEIHSNQVRMLILLTPAGLEEYFKQFCTPAPALTLPPPAEVPYADVQKLIAVASKYGIENVPS